MAKRDQHDDLGAWGTDGQRYWRGVEKPRTPEDMYDNELLSFQKAAALLGLSESYLRLAASHQYRDGSYRLHSYRVGMGNKRMVLRRDLHVFAMSRASSGQGSGLYKGFPPEYVWPPYTGERLAELEEEIAAMIELRNTDYRERHGSTATSRPAPLPTKLEFAGVGR